MSHKLKLNQYYVSRTTPNSSWEKCWVHEGPKHYTTYLWYSSDWILCKKMFISLHSTKQNKLTSILKNFFMVLMSATVCLNTAIFYEFLFVLSVKD